MNQYEKALKEEIEQLNEGKDIEQRLADYMIKHDCGEFKNLSKNKHFLFNENINKRREWLKSELKHFVKDEYKFLNIMEEAYGSGKYFTSCGELDLNRMIFKFNYEVFLSIVWDEIEEYLQEDINNTKETLKNQEDYLQSYKNIVFGD